jgi:hypothetical protein
MAPGIATLIRAGRAALAAWGAVLVLVSAAGAENTRIEELVAAVVKIKVHINPDGRTVDGLGREREGVRHPHRQ